MVRCANCGWRIAWLGLLAGLMHLHAAAQHFWDPNFASGLARSDYVDGRGSHADPLHLCYRDVETCTGEPQAMVRSPGAEGCLWDAADFPLVFSRCPGRAGLPLLTSGDPVWAGQLQRHSACGGDPAARIGDSWLDCLGYAQASQFTIGDPQDFYWAVHANVDPSFDQCNPGPPGLSFPVVEGANAVQLGSLFAMQFAPVPGAAGNRVDLSVNLAGYQPQCPPGINPPGKPVPFLSLGLQQGRGSSEPLALIGRPQRFAFQDKLLFTANLRSLGTQEFAHLGFFLIAQWQGAPRMIFVDLFSTDDLSTLDPGLLRSRWNWPLADSMFFPGGDIAVFQAGVQIETACDMEMPALSPGQFRNYKVKVSSLFRCAQRLGLWSDPMPRNQSLALRGVHFFVETADRERQGQVRFRVSRVRMR